MSFVLSLQVSTRLEIAIFAHEIAHSLPLTVPGSLLAKGWEALNQINLSAAPGIAPEHAPPSNAIPRKLSDDIPANGTDAQTFPITPVQQSKLNALHLNPFHLLGASPQDNRQKIIELAEAKCMESDIEVYEKACAILTHPRKRLEAEMSWLPGVSPNKAKVVIEQLSQDPGSIRAIEDLPRLAHANLLAEVLPYLHEQFSDSDLATFILDFASVIQTIDINATFLDINADRAIAHFPAVLSTSEIKSFLLVRKSYFRGVIRNNWHSHSPIDVMTLITYSATVDGQRLCLSFIHDVVDDYSLDNQTALERDQTHILHLITVARESAHLGDKVLNDFIDQLEVVVRNWNRTARPIQVSAKARGMSHSLSKIIAHAVRDLCVHLHNNHYKIRQAIRLTRLLQDLFSELPDFKELVDEDAHFLMELFHDDQAEASSV